MGPHYQVLDQQETMHKVAM